EGNAGFPCHRASQQGFAGPRRSYKQDPFGHARAQATVETGILEKTHHLGQFLLGLVHAGDISEGHLDEAKQELAEVVGFLKNPTTSASSCLASSTPATSAKVTLTPFSA